MQVVSHTSTEVATPDEVTDTNADEKDAQEKKSWHCTL